MIIRYFGAAQAAAGVEEETLELPEGGTLETVLREVIVRHSPAVAKDRVLAAAGSGGGATAGASGRATAVPARSGAPSMEAVIARSSFLRNEVAWKDRQAPLKPDDVIDILPPFAGG